MPVTQVFLKPPVRDATDLAGRVCSQTQQSTNIKHGHFTLNG
jgi:hypothetical protein